MSSHHVLALFLVWARLNLSRRDPGACHKLELRWRKLWVNSSLVEAERGVAADLV